MFFRKPEITHPDTWGCTEDYNEFIAPTNDMPTYDFHAFEVKQYTYLIPALKSDLAAIKKQIESNDHELNPAQKAMLKNIYLNIQNAGNDYAQVHFFRWMKEFVIHHRFSIETSHTPLNVYDEFKKYFPRMHEWFDKHVLPTKTASAKVATPTSDEKMQVSSGRGQSLSP